MSKQPSCCPPPRPTHVYPSQEAASRMFWMLPSTTSAFMLSAMVCTYWLSMGSCMLNRDR